MGFYKNTKNNIPTYKLGDYVPLGEYRIFHREEKDILLVTKEVEPNINNKASACEGCIFYNQRYDDGCFISDRDESPHCFNRAPEDGYSIIYKEVKLF